MDIPYSYKNWLIFPNSVFEDLDISDCNDTITGICESKSFEQCLNDCEDSEICDSGYFININGGTCVPIDSGVYKYLNPVYKIKNKSIYPVLQNTEIKTFVNKKFGFPPDLANAIFHGDFFELENITTRDRLSMTSNDFLNVNDISFSKEEGINLQIISYYDSISSVQTFIPIIYGQDVIINIPGTNLIFSQDKDIMKWTTAVLTYPQQYNAIKLHSRTQGVNSTAFYGDEIYMTYQDIYVLTYNEIRKTIELVRGTHESTKNTHNIYFRFLPRLYVYYCDKTTCKQIELKDVEPNGVKARYKGNIVMRNDTCWDICRNESTRNIFLQEDKKKKGIKIYIIIILFFILFVFLLIVIIKKMVK